MESLVAVVIDAAFWKNKKVFLTGHTGFKGAWAALWLQSMGARVHGFALEPSTNPSLFAALDLPRTLESEIGDIRDLKALQKSITDFKPEIVLHLAALPLVRYSYQFPIETFATNIMGTAHLLQAVRQVSSVRSVVVVTTDKVYENMARLQPYEEHEPLGGYDPYSSSKACAEIVTSAMRRSFYSGGSGSHPALIATARAGNVIGGGDWSADRLIPDLILSFREGKKVKIRNPAAVRPWQHVLEPLGGYFRLAQKLFEGEQSAAGAWNFGPKADDAKEVQYLVGKMAELWGGKAAWETDQGSHPHEAHYLSLSIEKVRKELGWEPHWSLDRALLKTADWYKSFYESPQRARELCLAQISEYQAESVHEHR